LRPLWFAFFAELNRALKTALALDSPEFLIQ
jgi:hypothetical protein